MKITLYNFFLYQRLRNLSTNENLWPNILCLKKVLDLRKKHLKYKIYVLITFYINLRLNIFSYFKIYKRVLKFLKQYFAEEKSLMKYLVVF